MSARRARRVGAHPAPPDENVFRSPCFPWESADLIIGEKGERGILPGAAVDLGGKTKLFMSSRPSQEIGGTVSTYILHK